MNIYVGNLPADISGEELIQEFSMYGNVEAVHLMNDKYIGSGQHHIYGYIEMASIPDGEHAIIGLKDKLIRGNKIQVIGALPLSSIKESDSNSVKPAGKYSKKGRQRTR